MRQVYANFKKDHKDAVIPKYETAGSAGMDLRSVDAIDIKAGERALISTGLSVELGFIKNSMEGPMDLGRAKIELQVRPRSGLAINKGITIVNSPGTVDQDYRGTIGVILLNTSQDAFKVNVGDRIAQAVIATLPYAVISETEELSKTERGDGGFGSTGVK